MTSTEQGQMELRVKVAKLCPTILFIMPGSIIHWRDTGLIVKEREWLNVCAEFEKWFLSHHTYEEWSVYIGHLMRITGGFKPPAWQRVQTVGDSIAWALCATATQRCLAFVATKEKTK